MKATSRSFLIREIRKLWKPRAARSHKGNFGRVLIIAGSRGMAGAAYLTAQAALRTGAGLVTLAVPDSIYTVVARKIPGVMVYPFPSTQTGSLAYRGKKKILELMSRQSVLAVGPGLSSNLETFKLIRELVLQSTCPVVLDADGLNAFQGQAEKIKKIGSRAVLTPHPGEFERLFGKKPGSSNSERVSSAKSASLESGATVVLKGSGTVIAACSRRVINPTGNPGMAKAGSGDVLTGVIAALLAQGFNTWDGARFGSFLHGLSGDCAVRKIGEVSLTAEDILDYLPSAIRFVRGI